MPAALFLVLSALLVCAILIPRGNSYWNFSDGVYLYTAQAVLDGQRLYTDIAAAQPPFPYYAGAAILGLGDAVASFRTLLALFNVLTGLLVLLAVHRLTRRPYLAAVAGALTLLTPRALHDTANLLPETFAAPLVMGAALLASRKRSVAGAGVIAALAIAVKLTMVLPAGALIAAAPDRRRYVMGLVAACITVGAVVLAVFGVPMLDGAVVAQSEVGLYPLHTLGVLVSQAGWNLLPFVPPVLAAWLLRSRVKDVALFRTVAATALGSLAIFVTIVKSGADINLVAVAEPPLLVLSVCGVAWIWESRERITTRLRVIAAATLASTALGVAQSGALLVAPDEPGPFMRPGSDADLGWLYSPEEVDLELARIQRCPERLAYSGQPYFAFLADHRMPGGQADTFIVTRAEENREFLRQALADQPLCP